MNINIMSIVMNLSYVLIPIVTIYLFKRIIECFKGKTEAKVKNDLMQLSNWKGRSRSIAKGEMTVSKTFSGEVNDDSNDRWHPVASLKGENKK